MDSRLGSTRRVFWTGLGALALGSLFAIGWLRPAQSPPVEPDPDQIADQFYPQVLIDLARPERWGSIPLRRVSSGALLDRFPDGAPRTIAACYSNGTDGALRVIQANTSGVFGVISEPTALDIGGVGCNVELVDLERDGVNEVHISFTTVQGEEVDWLFRFNGAQLQNLGPLKPAGDGLQTTRLGNLWLIDLDHDGLLEAVSVDGDFHMASEELLPTSAYSVYKLQQQGEYVPDRPLLYLSSFVRHTGAPQVVTEQFARVQDSQGPYVLRLVNGEKGGSRRVASARVVLNGVEVLSPNNFSQQVEFLSLPVTLAPLNTIEVTLAGTPLGEVILTIEDTSTQQGSGQ